MIPQSTETEPKLSELLTTAAIYQLDAQDTHQMNVMAEMAASLEAQVKAMREAGSKMAESVGQVAYEAEERGSLTPHATCIASAEELADNWNHLAASLDTPTPTPPNK